MGKNQVPGLLFDTKNKLLAAGSAAALVTAMALGGVNKQRGSEEDVHAAATQEAVSVQVQTVQEEPESAPQNLAPAQPEAQTETPQAPAPAPEPPAPPEATLPLSAEQQNTEWNCAPAAITNALRSKGHEQTQDKAAVEAGTTKEGTPSVDNVTNVMNANLGGSVYESKVNPSPEELQSNTVESIRDGNPVVANVKGVVQDTEGESHSFPGGHYVTIVGYQDGGARVTVADSYDTKENGGDGVYELSNEQFSQWTGPKGISEGAHHPGE